MQSQAILSIISNQCQRRHGERGITRAKYPSVYGKFTLDTDRKPTAIPSPGGWTSAQLNALPGQEVSLCGAFGPLYNSTLTMDQAGNLYGTSACAGQYNWGSVFKLTFSSGAWQYTSLHDFSNGPDGAYPQSNVVIDSNGNLFGTATFGGINGAGVIWVLTP